MFTGIINNLGKINQKTNNKLVILSDTELINKLSVGDSIAVNGICLTVVQKSVDTFSIDFIPETELKTNIKYLEVGNTVNLELPATAVTFLSGHIIQGHVDTIAKIKTVQKIENSTIFTFEISNDLTKYIINKGSITINGVSLTVIDVTKYNFTVGIIPHTLQNTNFASLKNGDFVNIEVDVLAKYLEKLVKKDLKN